MSTHNLKLYRHALSGHSHRVELFLSLLGLDPVLIDVDLLNGEHQQQPFLDKNPLGQVPVLEDGGTLIADSNAILVYLARKYASRDLWLPSDPRQGADVQRYLSIAAGELVQGPAAARLVTVFGATLDQEAAKARSRALFTILNTQLGRRRFLAGASVSIADLAMYTYAAHAPEGGIDLSPYPHLRTWLARIESLPGFVGMQRSPVALAA